ncbi:YczE/YyaS/YitT family protein [Pseudogracilibacillus sp. SE30717A]|uniref:YczE/YyaS/YitT family protein n=1 Tax=Pseudogracilibacillus sp. SE30717A TaxID=3098293 RepID=UPI003FA716C9
MIGTILFSFGISVTINMQHLGLHPWDVLNVGLFDKFGLTIGTWNIIIGIILVTVSLILDRTYVRIGTILNAFLVGSFVDFYLWLDFLPKASHTWMDVVVIVAGIVFMGIGGGIYNAAGIGSGPRDGFMLSISDKTGVSIGKVRIITETSILLLGLLIGGPVFIFTLIFTFVQSPIFQFIYLKVVEFLNRIEPNKKQQKSKAI